MKKEIIDYLLQIDGELSEETILENDGSLVTSGCLQSLIIVELCVMLEEKYLFEIELDDMEKSNFESLQRIQEMIAKYI